MPSEMVTASGAGMDPHIPPARRSCRRHAWRQLAACRVERVRELVQAHTEPPTFGFLGRARVNVLELNLALDEALGRQRRFRATGDTGDDHVRTRRTISIWDPGIVRQAVLDSFRKLDPRIQIKNPVMFIVEAGSLLTTIIFIQELTDRGGRPLFTGQVAFWLWFTVLFANFAEAMAEGRGKAQADTLRKTRTETVANRLTADRQIERCRPRAFARTTWSWCRPANSSRRRRDHRGRRVG